MKIYDISVEVSSDMGVWPNDPKPRIQPLKSLDNGDIANVSEISLSVHTGTHVDAPYHFLRNGKPLAEMPLPRFIGEARVYSVLQTDRIDIHHLEALHIPEGTERVLFKTDNSALWEDRRTKFSEEYVALTPDAARWIVGRGIRLVGIDYLSIQRFKDATPVTHLTLLEAETVILEGISLSGVDPGVYMLVCLPLKLASRDGAPARAVLLDLSTR